MYTLHLNKTLDLKNFTHLWFKNVYITTLIMTWIRKSIDTHLHFKMVFNFNLLIILNPKNTVDS